LKSRAKPILRPLPINRPPGCCRLGAQAGILIQKTYGFGKAGPVHCQQDVATIRCDRQVLGYYSSALCASTLHANCLSTANNVH
jgi:hypothetical protein